MADDANTVKMQLYVLRGVISEGTPDEQERVRLAAEKIRAVVAEFGDEGKIAATLVAMEWAAGL
jgi:hypothetical protein